MTKMMDALVKTSPAPGLKLMQVPVPEPKANEVLIRVKKSAICGTDVHIYKWEEWSKKNVVVPVTVGHEFVGEVAAVGSDVTFCKVGQRVSSESHVFCNHCRDCRAGDVNWCPYTTIVGVSRNGAFAEYICVPEDNVIIVEDDNIPDDIVAFFDAFGNATHTARMFDVTGANVLITGAGPIGTMAAGIAKYAGARRVVITDLEDYRLDLAKKMGADAAVNVKRDKLENIMALMEIADGFDVGMEMSGSAAALTQMIGLMRKGGKISLLGLSSGGAGQVDWNEIIGKGLSIQGITGRKLNTWHQMVSMLQGGLDMTPMVTHRYHYTDFEKGFEAMLSGKSGKVVFDWSK